MNRWFKNDKVLKRGYHAGSVADKKGVASTTMTVAGPEAKDSLTKGPNSAPAAGNSPLCWRVAYHWNITSVWRLALSLCNNGKCLLLVGLELVHHLLGFAFAFATALNCGCRNSKEGHQDYDKLHFQHHWSCIQRQSLSNARINNAGSCCLHIPLVKIQSKISR